MNNPPTLLFVILPQAKGGQGSTTFDGRAYVALGMIGLFPCFFLYRRTIFLLLDLMSWTRKHGGGGGLGRRHALCKCLAPRGWPREERVMRLVAK